MGPVLWDRVLEESISERIVAMEKFAILDSSPFNLNVVLNEGLRRLLRSIPYDIFSGDEDLLFSALVRSLLPGV